MYTPSPDLKAFVQSLPKTETHLHLEGACPFPLIQEVDPERFRETPPMWDDNFRYESFDQFMEMYEQFCAAVFVGAEAYYRCAREVFAKCQQQNVRYVEASFHLPAILFGQSSGPEVLAAIHEAAPPGMELRVFAGMCHNDYHGAGKDLIDTCLGWEQLAGIDLHGPEYLPLEPWTAEVWKRAAAEGKVCKAHAGEFMAASFVRTCIEDLGVRRIQHGVRCIEDPAVVDLILERDVTLDVCPISNVKLQVEGVSSMQQHPIRKLFDRGVRCTINSDDPFMFGNSLSEEYYALATDLAFTKSELAAIAGNGFAVADLPPEVRDRHLAEIATALALTA